MIRRVARLAALGIVGAALVDPACRAERSLRPRVGLVIADSPTLDLPVSAGDGRLRRAEARRVHDAVRAALEPGADVEPFIAPDQHARVVVGDRAPLDLVPALAAGREQPDEPGPVVSTIDVGGDITPNVAAVAIDVRPAVGVGSREPLVVTLRGSGLAGQTSTVTIAAGDLVLDTRHYTWAGDGAVAISGEIVPWREGLLPLRATVTQSGPEATRGDNVVEATTLAHAAAARVLVLDARPSWTSRFVTLALERDPQVRVTSRTALGRGITVQSGGDVVAPPLSPSSLDDFDVVAVSNPDQEPPAVMEWLEAFMRDRGGTVLVVADDIRGLAATRRWWPVAFRQQASMSPRAVADVAGRGLAWRASEFAVPLSLPAASQVIAASDDSTRHAVVVAHPVGLGRLVVNGALDAWRYRGDDRSAYAEFWRGLVVGLARDAVPSVAIVVSSSVTRPGGLAHASVRVRPARGRRDDPPQVRVQATGADAAGAWPVAVLPADEAGVSSGMLSLPPGSGSYAIVATAHGVSARAGMQVAADARPASPPARPLAWLAEAHGGVAADVAGADRVLASVRKQLGARRRSETVTTRPMRSPWWFAAFVLALGVEWFARRRQGLR